MSDINTISVECELWDIIVLMIGEDIQIFKDDPDGNISFKEYTIED